MVETKGSIANMCHLYSSVYISIIMHTVIN